MRLWWDPTTRSNYYGLAESDVRLPSMLFFLFLELNSFKICRFFGNATSADEHLRTGICDDICGPTQFKSIFGWKNLLPLSYIFLSNFIRGLRDNYEKQMAMIWHLFLIRVRIALWLCRCMHGLIAFLPQIWYPAVIPQTSILIPQTFRLN